MFRRRKKPVNAPVLLAEKRVYLRRPERRDAAAWLRVRRLNKDFLREYEPRWGEEAVTRNFFERKLQRQLRNWKEDTGYSFLVFKKDNALIGGMNINHICRGAAQYASLGYWIDEAHEGKGYMGEALALTIQFCFDSLYLNRINAACLPGNTRSKNLLRRAGFEEEGFAKRYMQINGTWQDHVLFGLVRPED
jgi:ribosomal-protein-alanine N-acetyltransferase